MNLLNRLYGCGIQQIVTMILTSNIRTFVWYNGCIMSFWHRILKWLGLRRSSNRFIKLNANLGDTLSALAEHTGKPENEVVEAVFASGLEYFYSRNTFWKIWETLTPRECDITALTCLGYTNPQMASRLGIGIETVKTHVANTLRKFNLHSKADLRRNLANWDFNSWL